MGYHCATMYIHHAATSFITAAVCAQVPCTIKHSKEEIKNSFFFIFYCFIVDS